MLRYSVRTVCGLCAGDVAAAKEKQKLLSHHIMTDEFVTCSRHRINQLSR